MTLALPLFLVEADALFSGGAVQGAIAGDLAMKHADWLAGIDHAPPWRVARGGLGFDFAPAAVPDACAAHFLPSGGLSGRALSLTLDSHTRAHADVPPVLRALTQCALALAEELGSAWVAWAPANMAYPRAFLAEQLAAWEDNGLIPLLAFVHFGEDAGGAMVTRGLSFFRLPEVRFTADRAMAKGDQVRRMIRMAYAMLADSAAASEEGHERDWDGDYDGLSPGERIHVRRRGDRLNLIASMPKSARE